MKQDGKQELKPKLRFPEFRDAGAWEKTKLGELLLASPSYGANAPAVPYSKQLPTYLRITDISDEGDFIQKNKVSVNIDAEADILLNEEQEIMYNDNQDWVCADCPTPVCQKRDDGGENVIARSVSARQGFNGTEPLNITCRWCGQVFAVKQSGLTIRRRRRAEVEGIWGTLPDMSGDEYLEEKQAS